MNIVDGACSKCGASTYYDGTLPILCSSCRTLGTEIESIPCLFKFKGSMVEDKTIHLPHKPQRTWREYVLAK